MELTSRSKHLSHTGPKNTQPRMYRVGEAALEICMTRSAQYLESTEALKFGTPVFFRWEAPHCHSQH